MRENVLGKEHPEYASSLNNLAILYEESSNYKEAERFYLESKVIREKY
ncbi:MAG: tetratricopeptide repeat protein [Saprospiraceae bacterium]|nr:tetratricopeptide repeat protein [Candidatus Defluviibacterium haderslevense]